MTHSADSVCDWSDAANTSFFTWPCTGNPGLTRDYNQVCVTAHPDCRCWRKCTQITQRYLRYVHSRGLRTITFAVKPTLTHKEVSKMASFFICCGLIVVWYKKMLHYQIQIMYVVRVPADPSHSGQVFLEKEIAISIGLPGIIKVIIKERSGHRLPA